MTRSAAHPLFLFTIVLLCSGCDDSLTGLFGPTGPPRITVTDGPTFSTDPRFGDLRVSMTVQNDGPGTAYEIFAQVTLRRGSYIVDRTTLYFGPLKEGESISDHTIFFTVTSPSAYTHHEVTLYWKDADNIQYQR